MEKVSHKVVLDKDENGMEKVMTNNDDRIYDFLVTCLDCPEVSKDIHLKGLDYPDNRCHQLISHWIRIRIHLNNRFILDSIGFDY